MAEALGGCLQGFGRRRRIVYLGCFGTTRKMGIGLRVTIEMACPGGKKVTMPRGPTSSLSTISKK